MHLSFLLSSAAILWTILAGLAKCQQSPSTENQKCGYEACNPGKAGMLNVHIVCHTHDDVGWVLTVQQYYQAYVREIIHSVIFHLNQDENRRFVYVESAFFHMWWEEQSLEMKNRVKDLVRSGRLEFVGGGWVMNDEAVTHYSAIIDQMTLGMRFLNETFGDCAHPKTVWQIDPFGHSREQASLFSQMGFDGQFLGRIDYQDIEVRRKRKMMEFLWRGNPSLGRNTELFTGVLPNVYWPPKGFCYDMNCWDEEITDQNALQKAYDFIHLVKEQAKQYKTNHTIITMGMDFYYRHAGKWYRNLEQLMGKINQLQKNESNVNIFFSTPACYLKSLNDQKQTTWHTETEDFFPYASEANSYWTGYFTSRPTSKYLGRRASAFLQTCKQIAAFGSMPTANIFSLQSAVGVMQHHDAMTGTEKLHVAHDYAKSLTQGIGECQNEVKTALSRIMSNLSLSQDLHFCNLLNQTECIVSETQSLFQLLVYNSLSREITSYARLPVTGEAYQVLDHNSRSVPVQIIPLQQSLYRIPERFSVARFELVFPLSLPALGTTAYTVRRLQDLSPVPDRESAVFTPRSDNLDYLVIQNEYIKAKVNSVTGLLEKVEINGREISFKQNYYYYTSQPGFQNEKASGAYSFNPVYETPLSVSNKVNASVIKGDLVQEVRQEFSPWVSQVIRLYKGKPYLEFDWIVGPIPTKDYYGKEVISKFETPLESNGTFYTDSNSRDSIERIRNFRPTWNLTVLEPVAGNYYPVTGWIYIRDKTTDTQLTVLPDRAQGGSSIHDGSLELMVHRRTLYDDGYGVDEALNELGSDGKGLIARGKHWVILGPVGEAAKHIRELSKELYHEPDFIFRTTNESTFNAEEQPLHYSYLSQKLPANVHLLSLEMLNTVEILVRLEHIYAIEEDSHFSKPVSVALRNLFCPFSIETVRETTLSAHQYLNTVQKLRWNENRMFGDAPVDARNETDSTRVPRSPSENSIEEELVSTSNISFSSIEFLSDQSTNVQQTQSTKDEFEIVLEPMEIRTFIVTVRRTLDCS